MCAYLNMFALLERACCARVMVSEMATPFFLEINSSFVNLCGEYVRELETQCFVHTVEIDGVDN